MLNFCKFLFQVSQLCFITSINATLTFKQNKQIFILRFNTARKKVFRIRKKLKLLDKNSHKNTTYHRKF